MVEICHSFFILLICEYVFMMAIIGGSGLYEFPELNMVDEMAVKTQFDSRPVYIEKFEVNGKALFFLPRHGKKHTLLPHQINYRANIDALVNLGVEDVVSLCSVGGINHDYSPGAVSVPHQIIDYTWGREHTFSGTPVCETKHIDFTSPFSAKIRAILLKSANMLSINVLRGCYGCAQGPRLETAAEINRLRSDGCDMVGMTLMPEAALARERNLNYAACAFVVNWAAGISDSEINFSDIEKSLEKQLPSLRSLLLESVKLFQTT